MIPGTWQQVLSIVTLGAVILGATYVGWPRRKGASRRREVLPPPSNACRRNGTEACP